MKEVLSWQYRMNQNHQVKLYQTTRLLNQVTKGWQRRYGSMFFTDTAKRDFEAGKPIYNMRHFSQYGITQAEADEVIRMLLY